jgi:hypothetical protein
MKKFLKKTWLFVLLAALATILGVFYFTQQRDSASKTDNLLSLIPPDIKTYNSPVPNLNNLENNFPEFKNALEVFQVNNYSISDQEALNLAQGFGYQDNPIITNNINGPIYSWSNEFNNLSIYLQEAKFQYGLDLLNHPELISGQPPDLQKTEEEFRIFLSQRNLIPQDPIILKPNEKDFYLIGGTNFIKTNSKNPQAKLTFLSFNYELNGLIINGPRTPLISAYFDNNFQIARFDYSKIFSTISLLNLYPIKNKEEVLKNLKNNPQISFLKNSESLYQESLILGETIPDLRDLSFNKIELIYYQSPQKQTYLQPVFLITGQAVLNDGRAAEVGIYLPAIKDEYLLK